MDVQWRKNGGNVIHCEGKSKHRGTETRRGYFLSFLKIQRIKYSVALVLYSQNIDKMDIRQYALLLSRYF